MDESSPVLDRAATSDPNPLLQMHFRRTILSILVLFAAALTVRAADPRALQDGDTFPRLVAQTELPLPHLIEVAPGLYSGSEPRGTEAFAGLKDLGITTVVSVDGARPDVESAAGFEIRYVHVPFGYDGIPEEAAAALTRVMRETSGPVYVHCHHGKHRGPAGAAICGLAAGILDQAGARRLLELAETSPDYDGLWRDVAAFQPLPVDAELPELRPVVEVESLTGAMARISRNFDRLKQIEEQEWRAARTNPDVVPHRVALLVCEDLTESARNLTGDYDAAFRERMAAAAATAKRLTDAVDAGESERAGEEFRKLGQTCSNCHADYRN